MDNQESHDDPQFVKVLETCLKMEIAAVKGNLDANMEEIKQLKVTMRSELKRRKELKRKITQMNKIKLILSETLTKLYISINEASDSLETMKANADDQYKLIQLRSQEYQEIVAEYKKTWHEYRDVYEEFPLAKARNAAKNNLEKLKIEHMVMSYKKAEMITIVKQRRRVNWIRTRCRIIEFVTMMLERLKLEQKLVKLKVNVKYHRKEFQSIEAELQVLRRKEEDQKRQRKQQMLEMAPPKINIPFREMYAQNQMRARVQQDQWKRAHEPLDDTISVNTLYLEELCINESTTVSPERMDVEATRDNNYKLTAVETERSDSKNTIVSEKDDTRAARAASVASNAEPSAEKAILADDNDVEMKEIHHEETQKSQEPVKTQPSYRITKESPLKHSAAKNTQDEIKAKRMRLQRQDSIESINKITTPQPSTIVKEMDLKSSALSVPKIKKIEPVHFNVTPLMAKPVQRPPTVAASSMFSPTNYEYCDSNMSSFDQDFISKGAPSLCEGSLCNYRLSPTSNISPICAEEDTQMAPSPKHTYSATG
ncbi:uncharacterized protein LOC112456605 [Temnothorax curvispinosus]|uniref:Uncharacterized protein LOC112456605 n=1 Tax=Temnothorax curvispinosus TaxID=300111 RepID=A0A6J1PYU2_9HYME|nr:uncharacterized protein LOC112456605 [Temnothorax curvispinosus]